MPEFEMGQNEKYKESLLNEIAPFFKVESQKDRELLNSLFFQIVQDKLEGGEELKFKHLLSAVKEMSELIDFRTNGMRKCTVRIDKGNGPDTANVYFDLAKAPWYFNYNQFGYIQKRNKLDFNFKLQTYNSLKFQKEFKFFNEYFDQLQNSNYLECSKIGFAFNCDKWA